MNDQKPTNNNALIIVGVGIALIAVVFAAVALFRQPSDIEQLGVTNLDSLHLSDTGGTATPVLRVNQDGDGKVVEFLDGSTTVLSVNNGGQVAIAIPTAIGTAVPGLVVDSAGTGNIFEVRDAATPVFQVNNGGAVNIPGNLTVNGTFSPAGSFDLNGAVLTIDADADTTLGAGTDDVITTTLGAAGGMQNWLVGNIKVGNGTPTVSLDGEDGYIEGTFEVDGATRFDGAMASTSTISQNINAANYGLPSIVTTAITYTDAAGGTGTVVTIPDGQTWLIHKVFVRTTTNFDCTGDDCTLVIGDGNDPNGFIDANDAALQAAFTEATGFEPGFYGIENGSGGAYTTDDGGPFVYLQSGAAETIDWLLAASGNDFSAGAATIYVIYTRIQ